MLYSIRVIYFEKRFHNKIRFIVMQDIRESLETNLVQPFRGRSKQKSKQKKALIGVSFTVRIIGIIYLNLGRYNNQNYIFIDIRSEDGIKEKKLLESASEGPEKVLSLSQVLKISFVPAGLKFLQPLTDLKIRYVTSGPKVFEALPYSYNQLCYCRC